MLLSPTHRVNRSGSNAELPPIKQCTKSEIKIPIRARKPRIKSNHSLTSANKTLKGNSHINPTIEELMKKRNRLGQSYSFCQVKNPEIIVELIKKCDVQPVMKIYNEIEALETESQPQICENIDNLIKVIDKSPTLRTFPPLIIGALANFAEKWIFHPIPEIPLKYLGPDNVAVMTISHLQEIQAAYHIFTSILIGYDLEFMIEKLTPIYIQKLLEQFSTPDLNEISEIEKLIKSIVLVFPNMKTIVYDLVYKLLRDSTDLQLIFRISPLLRLLKEHYEFDENGYTEKDGNLYIQCVLPLLNHHYLHFFYADFFQISIYLYNQDINVANESLKMILSHYPKTSTAKEVLCLHQLTQIGKFAPQVFSPGTVMSIFKLIDKGLCSPNYQVGTSCLNSILDTQFLKNMSTVQPRIVIPLLHGIKEAQFNWNLEINEKARAIYQQLVNLSRDDGDPPERKERLSWTTIALKAAENFDDFDISYYTRYDTSCLIE